MAREGETEITATFSRERASVKEESASGEAFAIGELSQARKLSSHGNRAGQRRGESSSEGAGGEEMQQSREGEAAPLRELGVGAPIGEEGI